MTVPPHHFGDEPADHEPGGLLGELERRQEDVLNQLDDLDAKLTEVLKGLDSTPMPRPEGEHTPSDASSPHDFVAFDEADADDHADDDFGSAEDWA